MLFKQDIYPENKIDTSSLPIQSIFEITDELAHNPALVILRTVKSIEYADLLWSANHIINPYTELVSGLLIKIPFLSIANESVTVKPVADKSINLKHIIKNNNKLTY